MVKILPSNTGNVGLIPGWKAKILHASQPKNQNINNKSNIVTNSIKTIKKTKWGEKKLKCDSAVLLTNYHAVHYIPGTYASHSWNSLPFD